MPFLSQMPDTRIPAGVDTGGGMSSPFGTLGAMMQIKEQQDIMRQRQLQEQQRQRDLQDEEAIRQTAAEYADDPDKAVNALYSRGFGSAAAKFGTALYNQRKAMTEDYGKQLDVTQKRLEQAGQILQGVQDESSFQTARPAMLALLKPIFGDAVEDHLGAHYDAERQKQLLKWGSTRDQQMRAEKEAADRIREHYTAGMISNPYASKTPVPGFEKPDGVEVGPQWSENAVKVQDNVAKELGTLLSKNGTNKQTWDAYLQMFKKVYGLPDEMLYRYAYNEKLTPEQNMQRAGQATLSVKESADIAHQQKQEGFESQRIALERQREQRLKENGENGVGGTNVKAITPSRVSEIKEGRDKKFSKLDEEMQSNYEPKDDKDRFAPSKLSAEDQAYYVGKRLQYENEYRDQRGEDPIEDAAVEAAQKGDTAGLAALRKRFEIVTGGLKKLDDVLKERGVSVAFKSAPVPKTPVERKKRLAELNAEFDRTKDAARRQAIQAEINKINTPTR